MNKAEQARWKRFGELDDAEFEVLLDNELGVLKDLLLSKRQSYGSHNMGKFGDMGALIRTSDKLERLLHMEKEGLETTAVEESRDDAWRDVAGYALLVLICFYLSEDGVEDGSMFGSPLVDHLVRDTSLSDAIALSGSEWIGKRHEDI